MSSLSNQAPTNLDLINLSDIFKIIWKRKVSFLMVFFVCIITSFYMAVKKGKSYEYSFLVQLPLNGNQESIVPMDDVRFKLKNTVVRFKKENEKESKDVYFNKIFNNNNNNNNNNSQVYLKYKTQKLLSVDRMSYLRNVILDYMGKITNARVNIYLQQNKHNFQNNIYVIKGLNKQLLDYDKKLESSSPFLDSEIFSQKKTLKRNLLDLELQNINLSYLIKVKRIEIKSVSHIENDKTKLILLAGVILSLIAAFSLVLMLDSISKNKK